MNNKTHARKVRMPGRRYRSPKNTLAKNCRVVLSPECDAAVASALLRHVPHDNITVK